jgi:hypothetical protein
MLVTGTGNAWAAITLHINDYANRARLSRHARKLNLNNDILGDGGWQTEPRPAKQGKSRAWIAPTDQVRGCTDNMPEPPADWAPATPSTQTNLQTTACSDSGLREPLVVGAAFGASP